MSGSVLGAPIYGKLQILMICQQTSRTCWHADLLRFHVLKPALHPTLKGRVKLEATPSSRFRAGHVQEYYVSSQRAEAFMLARSCVKCVLTLARASMRVHSYTGRKDSVCAQSRPDVLWKAQNTSVILDLDWPRL